MPVEKFQIRYALGAKGEPPRETWRLGLLSRSQGDSGCLMVVGGLELGGGNHADLAVQTPMTELRLTRGHPVLR